MSKRFQKLLEGFPKPTAEAEERAFIRLSSFGNSKKLIKARCEHTLATTIKRSYSIALRKVIPFLEGCLDFSDNLPVRISPSPGGQEPWLNEIPMIIPNTKVGREYPKLRKLFQTTCGYPEQDFPPTCFLCFNMSELAAGFYPLSTIRHCLLSEKLLFLDCATVIYSSINKPVKV